MGVVTLDDEPMRYDGPDAHVGKATTVPTLAPTDMVKLVEVEREVLVPLRCRRTASVQIGVPVGVQLVVL
jgi:hypothetical protein